MRRVSLRLLLLIVLAIGVVQKAEAGMILLQDDFNDNSLDTTKWMVTHGTVLEQNQRIELYNRGMLATVDQFDPLGLGGIRITGRYTFLDGTFPNHDMLQIFTRSDAVPSGSFSEVLNGVQFHANGNDFIQLTTRVNGVGTSITSTVPIKIDNGDVFDFEARDDGVNLFFSITEVGGDGLSASITGTSALSFATNRVLIYNREFGSGAGINYLDDVRIEQLAPTNTAPEPSSLALLCSGCIAALAVCRR